MVSAAKPDCIRQGVSVATEADAAICEIRDAVDQPDMRLGILFVDPALGAEAVEAAIQRHWPDVPLIGCTGWGHLSSRGLEPATISAASLAAPDFTAVSDYLDGGSEFDPKTYWTVIKRLVARLEREAGNVNPSNTFAMLLMGYDTMHGERIVNTVYAALGGINLFGGTAGLSAQTQSCWLVHGNAVRRDGNLLTLIHTRRPFHLFSAHHFRGTGERLVITGAKPSERLVTEINGETAAVEYAKLVGVSVEDLREHIYIERPIAVKIGDQYYLRSIERVNEDGTLLFACSLEVGMTLHVTVPDSMAQHLETEFRQIRDSVGPPDLMIASDCAHRRLTLKSDNERKAVSRLFMEQNAVGFGSYGEQFNRTHLNHTLTGVAIGAMAKRGGA